jgi:hypothetical protein
VVTYTLVDDNNKTCDGTKTSWNKLGQEHYDVVDLATCEAFCTTEPLCTHVQWQPLRYRCHLYQSCSVTRPCKQFPCGETYAKNGGQSSDDVISCNPSQCEAGLTCKSDSADTCGGAEDWSACGNMSERLYCPYGSIYNVMCNDGNCAVHEDGCSSAGVRYGTVRCDAS